MLCNRLVSFARYGRNLKLFGSVHQQQVQQFSRMSLDKFVIREKRKRAADKSETKQFGQASSLRKCSEGGTKSLKLSQSQTEQSTRTSVGPSSLQWRKITAENLDLDYVRLFSKSEADDILAELEKAAVYNTGDLAKVQLFGKWIDIPRKQTAYGEEGLTYSFSGNTVPARPWIPCMTRIRDQITELTGFNFNFVLVNRYKDGCDYMGEHKDDEKDLAPGHPIASLSLGQPRDFYFKHQDARGKKATRKMDTVKLVLEHGGLLLMNPPTNQFWYHALPQRKKLCNVRINLTFRKMNPAACKPVKSKESC